MSGEERCSANSKVNNHVSCCTEYKYMISEDRGVVANVLDCDIVVSEFALQSYYYIHFQTNTLEKYMNSIFLTTAYSVRAVEDTDCISAEG